MKRLKKTLAVTLSLVLCGSLVAPSFAAINLNEYIMDESNWSERVVTSGETTYTDKFVNLEEGEYEMTGDIVTDRTLCVVGTTGAQAAVNSVILNMNGHTLTHNGAAGPAVEVNINGDLTINGAGEDGSKGVITGANNSGAWYGNEELSFGGGGISAQNGAQVTVSNVSIEGNKAGSGGGVFAESFPGLDRTTTVTLDHVDIKGNEAKYQGAGLYANGAVVNITNSTIEGNHAVEGNEGGLTGGGISVSNNAQVTISDSTISGNTANWGGGIYATGGGNGKPSITVKGDSAITGNTAEAGGGGVYSNGKFTLEDGEISGNTAVWAGGVFNAYDKVESGNETMLEYQGEFTLKAGNISNNTATAWADDIYSVAGAKTTLPDAGDMKAALEDGKGVSGWYFDAGSTDNDRWGGTGEYSYFKYGSEYRLQDGCTWELCIKAAHDQYFVVTDGEGNELAEVEKGTEIDVSKLEEPTREGYTFIGWADENGDIVTTVTVGKAITLVAQWEEKEDEPEQPATPDEPVVTPEMPEDPAIEIDEPDVPLAGLPIDLEPEDKVTRAQIIAILHWMDSEPAAELATFIDVLADSDYAQAIGWAQEHGIALGVGGSRFAPHEYVTRGQLIEFLNRYAAYVGSDLVLELDGDAGEVLTWAVAEEIINDFFARL